MIPYVMNALFKFMRQFFPRNPKSDFETVNVFSSKSQNEMSKQAFVQQPETKAVTYQDFEPKEKIELDIIALSLIEPIWFWNQKIKTQTLL